MAAEDIKSTVMSPGGDAAAAAQAATEAAALKAAEANDAVNKAGEVKPPVTPEVPPPDKPPVVLPEKLSKADVDLVADEFIKDGKLSTATYEALDKRGLSKDLIDGYIEGVKAQTELMCNRVLGAVGGLEKYTELVKWAQKSLSDEAKAEFDGVMSTMKSEADMTAAVKKLQKTYEQAVGKPPVAPISGNEAASSGDAFASIEAMAAAMADPRYSGIGGFRDPAYIKSVEDRTRRMKG
jgi:hypothetical protein